jgi:hypothetical protein
VLSSFYLKKKLTGQAVDLTIAPVLPVRDAGGSCSTKRAISCSHGGCAQVWQLAFQLRVSLALGGVLAE